VLVTVSVMTIYLEISRRVWHNYSYDVAALCFAALAGAAVVSTLPGSRRRRTVRAIVFGIVAGAVLFVSSLLFVCISFGDCL
jgi:lysylphosphatidylglycerol synthetase-like protein (DUF2156 family)